VLVRCFTVPVVTPPWLRSRTLGERAQPSPTRFDVYPFILLNLAFSLEAAYAAPLILLAQTRQSDRDKAHADADAKHREALAQASIERQELAAMQSAQIIALVEQNTKAHPDHSGAESGHQTAHGRDPPRGGRRLATRRRGTMAFGSGGLAIVVPACASTNAASNLWKPVAALGRREREGHHIAPPRASSMVTRSSTRPAPAPCPALKAMLDRSLAVRTRPTSRTTPRRLVTFTRGAARARNGSARIAPRTLRSVTRSVARCPPPAGVPHTVASDSTSTAAVAGTRRRSAVVARGRLQPPEED
jgi:uncharacterized protein DUF1003